MKELGPALELSAAIQTDTLPSIQSEDVTYYLDVTSEHQFSLRFLPEKEMILISVAVGEPMSLEHYKTLLNLNGLHEQTGGVRMGLEDERNHIVMSFETALEELSLETLKLYLFNLAGILATWSELLDSDVRTTETTSTPAVDDATQIVRV